MSSRTYVCVLLLLLIAQVFIFPRNISERYINSREPSIPLKIESTRNQVHRYNPKNVYIDPLIKRDKTQRLFILLKDHTSKQKFAEILRNLPDTKIYTSYKIIPALFIEATPTRILKLISPSIGIIGIYSNRIYHLASSFSTEPTTRAVPTTADTADLIGADVFWDNGYDGSDIRVCVVDTGIKATHPELSDKVVASKSFVLQIYGYDKDITDPDDYEGHGTACAGIIAGKGLDPRGQGMAPGALLMNAKVFPPGGGATLAGIVAAIEWATYGPDGRAGTGDEADVISMSLGGGELYNSPIWLAIEKASQYGIIVSVSAGNEGDNQLRSMSVGDPGNSPYAVTSGATDPYYTGLDDISGNEYSSFGPTIWSAVKPDVMAPSGTLVLDYATGGYTSRAWHGTSFSCPHTSGALALIMHYLDAHGVIKSKRAAIAKAVLMKNADPLYEAEPTETIKYEDLMIGAGTINLAAVFDDLKSSSISATSYPQWLVILPKKIPVGVSDSKSKIPEHEPYFPYFDRVFNNQTICFNFSIIASKPTTIEISFSGNIEEAITLNSPTTISVEELTYYWECNFTVKPDAPEGDYEGSIIFNDVIYNKVIEVPISFKVVKPRIRILFDMRHTDWVIDYRYGQYRFLVRAFEKLQNSSVEMWYHGASPLTVDILRKYDLIFMPDAASLESIIEPDGQITGNKTNRFTPEEIEAIHQYISEGGVIIVFALDPEYHNLTNLNALISPTESNFTDIRIPESGDTVIAYTVGKHQLVKGVRTLPYYGIAMNISPKVEPLLTYLNYDLCFVYQNITGGAFIALGTNFMFDNWAFKAQYDGTGLDAEYVYRFAENIIEFADYGKDIIEWVSMNITKGEHYPHMSIVNITIKTADSVTKVQWIYAHKLGVNIGNLTYNPEKSIWQTYLPLAVSGPVYLKFVAYASIGGESFYVVRSFDKIYVESDPNDTTPPQIRLVRPTSGEPLYVIADRSAIIELEVQDSGGLALVGVTANITGINIKVIQREVTLWDVIVNVSWEAIEDVISPGKTIYIHLSISSTDGNMNTGSDDFDVKLYLENEPPTIEILSHTNGSTVNISEGDQLNVTLVVKDNIAIKNASIALNIAEEKYNLTLNKINDSCWAYEIVVPWSSLEEIFETQGGTFTLTIEITSFDVNSNRNEKRFVLILASTLYPTTTTTTVSYTPWIIVGILVVVAVVIAVLVIRKKSLSKT